MYGRLFPGIFLLHAGSAILHCEGAILLLLEQSNISSRITLRDLDNYPVFRNRGGNLSKLVNDSLLFAIEAVEFGTPALLLASRPAWTCGR